VPPKIAKADFDLVRAVAQEFPGVEVSTAWGAPVLKLRGKLMAGMAINKSAEPGSLFFRVEFERRDELIEGAPEIYYVTDHYVNYPSVLVRWARIDRDTLKDLVGMSYRYITRSTSKRPTVRRKRAGG